MGVPRVAVFAPEFTAAIGIDGPLERHVRLGAVQNAAGGNLEILNGAFGFQQFALGRKTRDTHECHTSYSPFLRHLASCATGARARDIVSGRCTVREEGNVTHRISQSSPQAGARPAEIRVATTTSVPLGVTGPGHVSATWPDWRKCWSLSWKVPESDFWGIRYGWPRTCPTY